MGTWRIILELSRKKIDQAIKIVCNVMMLSYCFCVPLKSLFNQGKQFKSDLEKQENIREFGSLNFPDILLKHNAILVKKNRGEGAQ